MNNSKINHFLDTIISLDKLELLVLDIPQKESFTSAIGQRTSRKALIIKWVNSNGTVGYGECSCRPDPFYSHEYVDGAVQVIKEFIFPQLSNSITYRGLLAVLSKIRGWNFTKAAVEFAANDVIRRETGEGILEKSDTIGINQVPVGISFGLFNSHQDLDRKLDEIIDLNYKRIKFKISSGYKNEAIFKRISTIDHQNISFDANGSFKQEAFSLLNKFAEFGHIIEQPFPPGDFYLLKEYLQDFKKFHICLDEDIESYGNLVSFSKQMDEVNIKPGRVGGLYNTLKMIDYCNLHGLDAWIGGMFETGIGRAQNLQVARLLPDAKAHDLSPSNRYFIKDVLLNPISMVNGYIKENAFMNIEVDQQAIESMTVDKIILSL